MKFYISINHHLPCEKMVKCQFLGCNKDGNYTHIKNGQGIRCADHKLADDYCTKNHTCEADGCRSQACFNYVGLKGGIYCEIHAKENMVDVKNKKCAYPGCTTRGGYGDVSNPKIKFCKTHAQPHHIDLNHKPCVIPGCRNRAHYNISGRRPEFCADHRTADMINFSTKKCKECKKKAATFNYASEISPEYCGACKDKDMVNVKHFKCKTKGCRTQPSYNFRGLPRLYCAEHKHKGMVDVINPRCDYLDCDVLPSFGIKGQKPSRCFEHKTNEMIDLKHKKCRDCNKRAYYNSIGESTPLFCRLHREIGMIIVNDKKCEALNCFLRARYGKMGDKAIRFCYKHVDDDCALIPKKCCQFPNCRLVPNYNFPIEPKAIFCTEHKLEGMVNLIDGSCEDCGNKAHYGLLGGEPKKCFAHKLPNFINLITHKNCSFKDCTNHSDVEIDGTKFCLEHKPENVDSIVKKKCQWCHLSGLDFVCEDCNAIRNKKEYAIISQLRARIRTRFEYNTSSMLNKCDKLRPDVFFELNKHCVIVEIDEKQHKGYSIPCECSRISKIVSGIGGLSVILIRFNPDEYEYTNPSGNGKEEEIAQVPLSRRVDVLIDEIKKRLIEEPDTFCVKMIKLYFDVVGPEFTHIQEEDITDLVAS